MDETLRTQVVRALRDVARLLELKGESSFKVRAYDIAADRIAGAMLDLRVAVSQGSLQELPGIGKAIAAKISELVSTGRVVYLEELRAGYPPNILELIEVPDLGPKKAAILWSELQIGNVDELELACKQGRVREVKGFGDQTEQKILDGIAILRKQRQERSHRRRMGDVLPHAEELLAELQKVPGVARVSIAGSLRRRCETVSDLDLVAGAEGPEDPPRILNALANSPHVEKVLGIGPSKCSVRLYRDALQVDLRVLPDEDFATALHHFTGSKAHHIRLRGIAQSKGLKLSEWGVHRGEEKLKISDEREIYTLLGMQYVPPELREDQGEVEAALAGTLPDDSQLLAEQDVKGVVHSHSTWSDGKASLEDMATAARGLGFSYLTVTEHSQTASYAGGLTPDRLRAQWDEIDRLNRALPGITLLKGIETDILADGGLDYPDELLSRLDVVIGSIHARHKMDEAQMTERVLAALDSPHLHILGHLTGRLINSREPYALRIPEIFEKAARKGVAIEVNGSPHRLDIKAEHVRMALSAGVKLVASCDSHSVRELKNARYSVATARKGWARREDVLNTLGPVEFVGALRALKRAAHSNGSVL